MKRLGFSLASLILLASPFAAHAAFSFTEIMYDASGTDTKHEWVEVYNDGAAIDLATYKLFENGSNHGLTLYAGTGTVAGYAIIADDAATFVADFPSYSGAVFDAAFSLSNTGETLALRDASLADVASATYTSDAGAAGDGNTLNLVSGTWVSRVPTPGATAASGSTTQPPSQSTSGTSADSTSNASASGVAEVEVPTITVEAGTDRAMVVGAGSVFTATAFGIKGTPIANARYVWNFGNGSTREGTSVLHTYSIPGTYVVTVDASNEGFAATDRVTVTVVVADIVVTRADQTLIEIENRTAHELDIGLWQLAVGNQIFVLPVHTVLVPKRTVAFPSDVTGLRPESVQDVVMLYPNGTRAGGLVPETLFIQNAPPSAPASAPVAEFKAVATSRAVAQVGDAPSEPEPKVLGASATRVTPTWAWVSFALLALMIAAGLGAVVYLQFKP